MSYEIKAIPTRYKGRIYRSKLEARYAAFFDLLGWKYEYEPHVPGIVDWSPDFNIFGEARKTINLETYEQSKYSGILIEVKPSKEYFDNDTFNKMYHNSKEYTCIVCFDKPHIDKQSEMLLFGLEVNSYGNNLDEIFFKYLLSNGECDISSYLLNWDGLIHGNNDWRKYFAMNYDAQFIVNMWEEACNKTMFKKPV
jgi:hypothetical protein